MDLAPQSESIELQEPIEHAVPTTLSPHFHNADLLSLVDMSTIDIKAHVKAKIKDLTAQVVKLKTDKDVSDITIKHLKTELETKTALARRQAEEMASLRETVLELQR